MGSQGVAKFQNYMLYFMCTAVGYALIGDGVIVPRGIDNTACNRL